MAELKTEDYKYGFSYPERSVFKTRKGLDEDIIRQISAHKGEPEWMLNFRLKSLEAFRRQSMPNWGADLSGIDFEDIFYYIKPTDEMSRSWMMYLMISKRPLTVSDTRGGEKIPGRSRCTVRLGSCLPQPEGTPGRAGRYFLRS